MDSTRPRPMDAQRTITFTCDGPASLSGEAHKPRFQPAWHAHGSLSLSLSASLPLSLDFVMLRGGEGHTRPARHLLDTRDLRYPQKPGRTTGTSEITSMLEASRLARVTVLQLLWRVLYEESTCALSSLPGRILAKGSSALGKLLATLGVVDATDADCLDG